MAICMDARDIALTAHMHMMHNRTLSTAVADHEWSSELPNDFKVGLRCGVEAGILHFATWLSLGSVFQVRCTFCSPYEDLADQKGCPTTVEAKIT